MLNRLLCRIKPVACFLLNHSPPSLETRMIESLVQLMFDEAQRAGELEFMEGRVLSIHLLDVDRQWFFQGNAGRIQVFPGNGRVDACISGDVKEFILLAGRLEDPDTLFFQRRLNIEGDIELSLAVKNLIDSLEPITLPKPLRQLLKLTQTWVRKGYLQ